MFSQKGSAALLAVGVMLFLTIIAAAIVPYVATALKQSRTNGDMVEARFAAEAGAKRAINAFNRRAADWQWLGLLQPLTNNAPKESNGYTVTVAAAGSYPPAYINPSGYPPAGKYEIKATGSVNGISKTVTVTYTVAAANSPFTKAMAGGGDVTIFLAAIVGAPVASSGDIRIFLAHVAGMQQHAGLALLDFTSGGQFDPAKYKSYPALPAVSGRTIILSREQYYVKSSCTIADEISFDVTTPSRKTTIYVDGDLTIGRLCYIKPGDNILFIVNGNLHINEGFLNWGSYGNTLFAVNGNVVVDPLSYIEGAIWANGTINFAGALLRYSQATVDLFGLNVGGGSGGSASGWH